MLYNYVVWYDSDIYQWECGGIKFLCGSWVGKFVQLVQGSGIRIMVIVIKQYWDDQWQWLVFIMFNMVLYYCYGILYQVKGYMNIFMVLMFNYYVNIIIIFMGFY